jgi:3-oxoacyl-[acyl-carrier-protein] synthase II
MGRREVVITGMGVVSPVASELNRFWEGIKNGQSGITRVENEKVENIDQYAVQIGGVIKDLDVEKYLEKKDARKMDPFSVWGVSAAAMAVEDANFDFDQLDLQRVGVIASSGIGGMQIMQEQCIRAINGGPRRISPQLIPQMITNILINDAGQVLIDDAAVGQGQVRESVSQIVQQSPLDEKGNPRQIFSILTGKATRYGIFIDVLDQVKQAGATKISIAEPRE